VSFFSVLCCSLASVLRLHYFRPSLRLGRHDVGCPLMYTPRGWSFVFFPRVPAQSGSITSFLVLLPYRRMPYTLHQPRKYRHYLFRPETGTICFPPPATVAVCFSLLSWWVLGPRFFETSSLRRELLCSLFFSDYDTAFEGSLPRIPRMSHLATLKCFFFSFLALSGPGLSFSPSAALPKSMIRSPPGSGDGNGGPPLCNGKPATGLDAALWFPEVKSSCYLPSFFSQLCTPGCLCDCLLGRRLILSSFF